MKRTLKHVDDVRDVRPRTNRIADWDALIAQYRYSGTASTLRNDFVDIESLRTSDPVYYAGCMPMLAENVEHIDRAFVLSAVPLAYADDEFHRFEQIANLPLFVSDSYVYLACSDYNIDEEDDAERTAPNLYVRRTPLPIREAHNPDSIHRARNMITTFATNCVSEYGAMFQTPNDQHNSLLGAIVFNSIVLQYFTIIQQFITHFPAVSVHLFNLQFQLSLEQRQAIVSIGLGALFRFEGPHPVTGFDNETYVYYDNNGQIITVYSEMGFCTVRITPGAGPLVHNALEVTIAAFRSPRQLVVATIASGLCQLLQDFEQATAHNITNEDGLVTVYYNIQLHPPESINWHDAFVQTTALARFLLPHSSSRVQNIPGSLVFHRDRYSVVFCHLTSSGFIATLIAHEESADVASYYTTIVNSINNRAPRWESVIQEDDDDNRTNTSDSSSSATTTSSISSSSSVIPVPSLARALHNAQIQVQTRSLQQLFTNDEEVPDLRTPSPLSPATLSLIYSRPRQYEEVPDLNSPSPRSSSDRSRLSRQSNDIIGSEEYQSYNGTPRNRSPSSSWHSSAPSTPEPPPRSVSAPLRRSRSSLLTQHPSLAQLTRSLDRVLSSICE